MVFLSEHFPFLNATPLFSSRYAQTFLCGLVFSDVCLLDVRVCESSVVTWIICICLHPGTKRNRTLEALHPTRDTFLHFSLI